MFFFLRETQRLNDETSHLQASSSQRAQRQSKDGHSRRTSSRSHEEDRGSMQWPRIRSSSDPTSTTASGPLPHTRCQLGDGATLPATSPKDKPLEEAVRRTSVAHTEDKCLSLGDMELSLTSVFGQAIVKENKQLSEALDSPTSSNSKLDDMIDGTQYPSLQNYSMLHGLVGPACIFLRQSIAISLIDRKLRGEEIEGVSEQPTTDPAELKLKGKRKTNGYQIVLAARPPLSFSSHCSVRRMWCHYKHHHPVWYTESICTKDNLLACPITLG